MLTENIKKLVHNNFREYFLMPNTNTRIVKIIDIPISINEKTVLCTFESELLYRESTSKLIWNISDINLLDYETHNNPKEPIYILSSSQIATSFYLLEMSKNNVKINLHKKSNKSDKIEIIVSFEIAEAITKEFRSNYKSICINWLTKDEMLKNK